MNEPKNDGQNVNFENFNFGVTARDRFFQEMLVKYGLSGVYVTDIVKKRDLPRLPTADLGTCTKFSRRAPVVRGPRPFARPPAWPRRLLQGA
ncbi:MAG: hypothetical protein ABSE73_22915 [Planctomycetota bacterium]